VPPPTKHALTDRNTHTGTYSYMFTNVYTLTYKLTVQHIDMYSQRPRPDTDTHKYMCKTGMHRYIYAHRHMYLAIQLHTHMYIIRDKTRHSLTQR